MTKGTSPVSIQRVIYWCIFTLICVFLIQSYKLSLTYKAHVAENTRLIGEISSLISKTRDVRKWDDSLSKPLDEANMGSGEPSAGDVSKKPIGLTSLTSHNVTELPRLHHQPEDKISESVLQWFRSLRFAMSCVKHNHGGLFFYHTRKAAGTTIKEWLDALGRHFHVQSFQSEGISLNNKLLEEKNLLSVTALRHPIDRILSLYWYEHVAWWLDIQHDMSRCRPLHVWVEAWRDGSSFKNAFVRKNPGRFNHTEVVWFLCCDFGLLGGVFPGTW